MAQGMFGAHTDELRLVAESFSEGGEVLSQVKGLTISEVQGVRWLGHDATVFRGWYGGDVASAMVELAALLGVVSGNVAQQAGDQDATSAGTGTTGAHVGLPTQGGQHGPQSKPSNAPGGPNAPLGPGQPQVDSRMDEASGFVYDRMSEWTQSSDYQFIYNVARQNPAVFNELLEAVIDARAGDPVAAAKALALGALYPDMVIAAYKVYDQFKTGGPWDMKPYLADEYGHPLNEGAFEMSDSEGNRIRSDAYGNVAFGAMLANAGVSEEVALKAANAGGGDVGRGDDPLDDDAVRAGYDMVREYPGGMTREQFQEAMDLSLIHI